MSHRPPSPWARPTIAPLQGDFSGVLVSPRPPGASNVGQNSSVLPSSPSSWPDDSHGARRKPVMRGATHGPMHFRNPDPARRNLSAFASPDLAGPNTCASMPPENFVGQIPTNLARQPFLNTIPHQVLNGFGDGHRIEPRPAPALYRSKFKQFKNAQKAGNMAAQTAQAAGENVGEMPNAENEMQVSPSSWPSTSTHLPPSDELLDQKPGIAADGFVDSVQIANHCQKLWVELERAMKLRERALKSREARLREFNEQKEAVKEEKRLAGVLKAEACTLRQQAETERRKIQNEVKEVIAEKEAMERTSTDIAVQLAELRQMQRQIEKDKAALQVQKEELEVKEKALDEWEHTLSARESSLGVNQKEGHSPQTPFHGNKCKEFNPQFASSSVEFSPTDGCQPISNVAQTIQSGNRVVEDATPVACRQVAMLESRSTEKISLLVSQVSFIKECSTEVVDEQYKIMGAPVKAEPTELQITLDHDSQVWVPELKTVVQREEEKGGEEPGPCPPSARRKFQRVGQVQRREVEDTKQPQDLAIEVPRKIRAIMKQEAPLLGGKPLSDKVTVQNIQVSIETALQEDAPGLLEQLQDKGLLEGMQVYGEAWDDGLDAEGNENAFGELENVIGKLWRGATGFTKDLIASKGLGSNSSALPHYCLACLLSLIEQTKSLRRRKWPVEWGWCRRLHAFLFVFEKHNRIVMERPEYGFATYFFELVQTLPVQWQVQRLITVMSVASTGRAALLENRQLEVGRDITDEEAVILEDYGWNRNSGLGSLLNFCHRVVHDHNKGGEGADLGTEWKVKIGKLLMDGHDQGGIVQSVPRKLQKVVLPVGWANSDSRPDMYIKAEPAWPSPVE